MLENIVDQRLNTIRHGASMQKEINKTLRRNVFLLLDDIGEMLIQARGPGVSIEVDKRSIKWGENDFILVDIKGEEKTRDTIHSGHILWMARNIDAIYKAAIEEAGNDNV